MFLHKNEDVRVPRAVRGACQPVCRCLRTEIIFSFSTEWSWNAPVLSCSRVGVGIHPFNNLCVYKCTSNVAGKPPDS